MEIYSGSIPTLIKKLETQGYKKAYIDAGVTITTCINLHFINEITLTLAPILLGKSIPLFGDIFKEVKLANAEAFPNNFVELKYTLKYL